MGAEEPRLCKEERGKGPGCPQNKPWGVESPFSPVSGAKGPQFCPIQAPGPWGLLGNFSKTGGFLWAKNNPGGKRPFFLFAPGVLVQREFFGPKTSPGGFLGPWKGTNSTRAPFWEKIRETQRGPLKRPKYPPGFVPQKLGAKTKGFFSKGRSFC